MNLSRLVFRPPCLYRQFSCASSINYARKFLSEGYECNDVWKRRVNSPILSKINLDDLFFEMDKRYNQDKAVSSIDVDLYINRVDLENYNDEVEELVYRLRKSSSTAETLPSTGHAAIRYFIMTEKLEDLLRLLNDRMNYGLFLDDYLSNLLMDSFLAESNYKSAAKVASLHMLQEDFGSPLTQYYCLFSTLKYLENPSEGPWEPEPEPDPRETSREETKIKVQFLRQPGFDDHFDLTDGSHVLGKTLALLSMNLSEVKDENFLLSLELYGWALYDKWEKVENILNRAITKKQLFSSEVITKVLDLAQSKLKLIEESETKSLPRPKLKRYHGMNLDAASVDKLFQHLNLPDYSKLIPRVITILNERKFNTVELALTAKAEELLKEAVPKYEKAMIEQQCQLYAEWENIRSEALNEQIRQYRNEKKLQEIEVKKKELQEKEDTIFFFDNEEEWMLRQPPAVKVYKMRFRGKYKPPKVLEDTTYVPPTL